MLKYFLAWLAGVVVISAVFFVGRWLMNKRRIVIDPVDAQEWQRITNQNISALRKAGMPPITAVGTDGKVYMLIDREHLR